MNARLFPPLLAEILPLYGTATAMAERVGLSLTTLTRAQKGERDLGADSLEALIAPMLPEHQARLAEAWLMDLRNSIPSASMVRVTAAPMDEDRLSKAVALLPATLREKLAVVLEQVSKDPASGYPMIEGLAALVSKVPTAAEIRLNEPGVKYEA